MATESATEPTIEELAAQEKAGTLNTPPTDPPADPPADPPEGKDPPKPDPEPDSDSERMKLLEETTGLTLADRYSSADEAGKGIRHAIQLVGQKNVDAAEMRELREKLSPDQLEKLKSGEVQGPSPPATESKLPRTHGEYKLLMANAAKLEKEALPGYQDDPVYRRAIAAQDELGERAFQAPDKLEELEAEMAELKKGLSGQQADSLAAAEKQRVDEWTAIHANELWQKDKPGQLTALGSLTDEAFRTHPLCRDKPDTELEKHEIALLVAKGNLPVSGGTRTPGKNATQQPGTRTTTNRSTYEEILKQMPNDEPKAFELYNKQCLDEEKAAEA